MHALLMAAAFAAALLTAQAAPDDPGACMTDTECEEMYGPPDDPPWDDPAPDPQLIPATTEGG